MIEDWWDALAIVIAAFVVPFLAALGVAAGLKLGGVL